MSCSFRNTIIQRFNFFSLYFLFLWKFYIFFILFIFTSCYNESGNTKQQEPSEHNQLHVFCGSISKPPMEEIVPLFEKKTGIKILITYGGSGYLLSQIKLTEKGDIYLPGSSDFMEKAKEMGIIYPESEKILVYLIPEICVQRGNPKKIMSLNDLAKKDIKIAIGHPENVCVGTYAVEIFDVNLKTFEQNQVKKNIVNYTESCEKTATLLSLKTVDAILGWDVFKFWDTTNIEGIKLQPHQIKRIGYIPVAIIKFTNHQALAEQFIKFLLSDDVKKIFRKYHYHTTLQEVNQYIYGDTISKKMISAGGMYNLPKHWFPNK